MGNLTRNTVILSVLAALFYTSPANAVPPPWAYERHRAYDFYPDYSYPAYPANNTVVIVRDRKPTANVVVAPDDYYNEYPAEDGRYCREYRSQTEIAGKIRTTYGTACQQPDGQWVKIN